MVNYDPLLSDGGQFSLPELEKENEAMRQRIAAIRRQGYKREQPQTPVWDEIDRITSSLSDKEYHYLQGNEDFRASSEAVNAILQREYMRVMRPIVEQTKDGKEALEQHLSLLKRLVKNVKNEADKRDALFDEYIREYSDRTWQEFIAMKNGRTQQ